MLAYFSVADKSAGPNRAYCQGLASGAGMGRQRHTVALDTVPVRVRIALETSRGEIQWNCFPAQI